MIQFKAKIKNSNEYITGSSLIKHDDGVEVYVITNEIQWIDGSEWNCRNFEFIDITTLEVLIEKLNSQVMELVDTLPK